MREDGDSFASDPAGEGPFKLSFILEAARFIRRERIQVVHGHHGRDFWRTVFAARFSGVQPRVVLTRHLAKSPSSWPSKRFLLGQTDAMVANSRFVARILTEGMWEPDSPEPERRSRPPLRGDHSKIHVIHEGTDIDRFRPLDAGALRKEWGVDSNHFVFGVVGGYNLPRGKGQREFLRAAAPLAAKFDRARFVLVGRGDLEETLRRDIEQLGLQGRAQLTPWYSDMPPVMNAIDCLVHPQIGTEAFPSVVLEAMACAKPVIGTSVDGIPEQVVPGETGLLVPPEDLAALGDAMTTILQDPRLAARFGAAGRERVCQHFTLAMNAEKNLALYRQLLAG